MKNFKILFFLLISYFFVACSSDDAPKPDLPLGAYDNGVFVLNEGNFGSTNSTISFFNRDFSVSQVSSFSAVNPSINLGGVGNDMAFDLNNAYIVMNGSNTVQVVNRYTLQSLGNFTNGLSNPRNIVINGQIAYISNWGNPNDITDDFIAVYNLQNRTLVTTIPVIEGPENMVFYNNKLYVAQKGGFGFGNAIVIINATNNQVLTTITVADVPESMKILNNTLYVLSSGKPAYSGAETAGRLSKINLGNNLVESSVNFATTFHPGNLCLFNNEFYFTEGNNVYTISPSATTPPSTILINGTTQNISSLYSLELANNYIYTGDAKDYNSNGRAKIFSLNGNLVKDIEVGVTPTGFYFNF